MPRRDGIDVSRWQDRIDWNQVKAAGVTWVCYQALKGESPDPTFAYNRSECARLGFPIRLVYGYPTTPQAPNQPTAMPWNQQAALFNTTIGHLLAGEGVMCDAEVDGITEALTLTWCQTVEQFTGRPCSVYTGGYVAGGTLWRSNAIFNGHRPRVFAAYSSEAEAHKHAQGIPWDVWQWTGSGTCPGVIGACDEDQVDNAAAFAECCGTAAATDDSEGWDPALVYPAW